MNQEILGRGNQLGERQSIFLTKFAYINSTKNQSSKNLRYELKYDEEEGEEEAQAKVREPKE